MMSVTTWVSQKEVESAEVETADEGFSGYLKITIW